jgi:hypothetical protein
MKNSKSSKPLWRRIPRKARSSGVGVAFARLESALGLAETRRRKGDLLLGRKRDAILLLYACVKNDTEDLTPKQVAQLARAVKEEFR